MPDKIALYIARKLADEKTRKTIVTVVMVFLSIVFLASIFQL